MASKTGIRQHSVQRFFSGARVAFDPRRSDEVEKTRDPQNYRTLEKYVRTAAWERRQAEQRNKRVQDAVQGQ